MALGSIRENLSVLSARERNYRNYCSFCASISQETASLEELKTSNSKGPRDFTRKQIDEQTDNQRQIRALEIALTNKCTEFFAGLDSRAIVDLANDCGNTSIDATSYRVHIQLPLGGSEDMGAKSTYFTVPMSTPESTTSWDFLYKRNVFPPLRQKEIVLLHDNETLFRHIEQRSSQLSQALHSRTVIGDIWSPRTSKIERDLHHKRTVEIVAIRAKLNALHRKMITEIYLLVTSDANRAEIDLFVEMNQAYQGLLDEMDTLAIEAGLQAPKPQTELRLEGHYRE